jgi:hypothetical protein
MPEVKVGSESIRTSATARSTRGKLKKMRAYKNRFIRIYSPVHFLHELSVDCFWRHVL